MNNILKFEEYIKEGFLSKTYDRYRTGEKRTEDKKPWDNIEDAHTISDEYQYYYILDIADGNVYIDIFHYPKEDRIAYYIKEFEPGVCPEIDIMDDYSVEDYDGLEYDEKVTLNNYDFRKALNNSLLNLPESTWD